MSKLQATELGELVEGDDPPHPTEAERLEVLTQALTAWNWTATFQTEKRGRFLKFTAETATANHAYTLEIYPFANLSDSARGRGHEKRIQLTRDYAEHEADFALPKQGNHRCLLLGLYHLSAQQVVICAWDAAAYQGHSSPSSCYVQIQAIADAFRLGFARSRDAKGRYVCCFRPEFMYYYLEHMGVLHNVEAEESNPVEDVTAQAETAETLAADLLEAEPEGDASDLASGARNLIYYGAPGTGKSHKVNELVAGHRCVRTVFHPDMQHSDFVGALKPQMHGDRVTYVFAPGPFALALEKALNVPQHEVYLVIEELNRAPAAAVFGDLFLLLDRNAGGGSKYHVDFPNPEFQAWLSARTSKDQHTVSLPANLWLVATMNSADQGVYPLDTAFRRRWEQEYIPIDYSLAPRGTVTLASRSNATAVEWGSFASALNHHLSRELAIAEDRLLGPWFVTAAELAEGRLPGKVLIYLWDDLLRHHGREKVFDLDLVKTYGEVAEHVRQDLPIFNESFLSRFFAEASATEA